MANTPDYERSAPLEEALAQNVEATEEVKHVVDNLAVVHAVLDQAPNGAPPGDLDLAAEKARKLEKQLSTAAEKLEDVNEKLADELKARRLTEGGAM